MSAFEGSLIGRTLLGRYRIVRQLAEGGMGVVYLARAEGAAGFIKPVVLKLILPKLSASPQFLGMFVREAQILAQLRHPGIVDVIEFGEQDGAYIMVLEYVAGYHLGQWQVFLKRVGRVLPSELAIQIVIGVLDALHHVHTQTLPDGTALHITHRDVSPSNILLSKDGHAKLVDFGVARMASETLFRTEGSGFRGKIVYSAPEMFEGGEATPQSDVYSCAAVLHELLIGRNVFAGKTQAETLARVIHHVPDSVHAVRDDAPDEIDEILTRALAKRPAERYPSAAAFAAALRTTQRASEPELRERLAALVRADFTGPLAELLGLESLAMRERAWRRFSAPPPPPALPVPPPATGVSLEQESIHDQPTRALEAPLQLQEPAEHAPPASAERPRRLFALSLALSAIAVVVAGIALWRLGQTSARAPEPIVLVQHEYRPAAPPHSEPAPVVAAAAVAGLPAVIGAQGSSPHAAGATAAQPPAPAAPAPDPAPAPRPLSLRAPSAPDAAALTRTFRQKQKQIEACFAAHGADLPGESAAAIHFQVDGAGRPEQVGLIPEALGDKALGTCLRKVALATRFPAAGKPLSFRIPVTARRVAVQ